MKEPTPSDNTNERPAFTHPLKLADYGNYRLREFDTEMNQNHIIRPIKGVTNDIRLDTTRRHEIYEELEKEGENLSKHVKEFIDAGIMVPPCYFVVGDNDKNTPILFQTIAKVEGTRLSFVDNIEFTTDRSKEEFTEQFALLINSLIKYLKNKIESQSDFPDDIFHLKQYVFGNIDKDKSKKIYLVDAEPTYIEEWISHPANVAYALLDIELMIQTMGKRIGSDHILDTQKKLDDFIAGLSNEYQLEYKKLGKSM